MRLRLFVLSPIFLIILAVVVYIVYMIYYTPIMLCDDNGWTLYELKTKLTSEVAKYRISNINVEKYYDLHEQLKQISHPNYRNISLEEEYINNIKKWISEYNESLTKINQLETSIKRIEPDFKSPISINHNYPRVGRRY